MKILTEDEKNIVAGVLLNSRKFNELMDNPNHPNVWALDYAHDSRLRKEFESQLDADTQNNFLKGFYEYNHLGSCS